MSEKELESKLILDHTDEEKGYSEGEIEDEILKIFKSRNSRKKVDRILENSPSWPMFYHLSDERENLLNWYPFKKDASLLEVGSGCGALTGLFCRSLKKVTAIELTEKRATITALRNRDNENLTVIAGNLNKILLDEKFDYATSIGVLEYAGEYTDSKKPFLDFLIKLKSSLKKNGTLIIAIENKFGLKYWSGVSDDHTGRLFDSIEGYPNQKRVKTFERNGLEKLLKNVGFRKIDFYYPLPDYKFPREIFSDEYPPTQQHNIRAGLLPAPDLSQERIYLFDERLVSDNIILSNHFGFFANSFLVFASGAG
ncbi:MAG: methyltransferase domain-containing protein [Candidatus Aenigmarchaeota archaeon]|nr:methyltransferase domain-containing protein [Candidatus Aenigmarchaeota archaeon]